LDPLINDLPPGRWGEYQWSDIIPSIQKESRYQDLQYIIPYFNDGHILFYRKDLIDLGANQTPREISPLDLLNIAQKAHQPPDIYGIALKAHPSEILFDWLPYFFAAGGQLTDTDIQPTFAAEEGFYALRIYCQLRDFAPPKTHTFGNEEIAAVIKSGQAAVVTTWGGQAAPIFLDQSNAFRDKYLTAVFPHPCGATWGIALPANQPREIQLEALQKLLLLNSPEQDLDVLEAAGSPIRNSSYSEQAFQDYFWLRAQYEILNRFAFLPFDPRIGLYLGPLTEAILNAFLGQETPEESLKKADHQIREALEQ
jgi:multiple sugar transport system substrate-binding protein